MTMSLFQTRAWQDAWWKFWGDTPGFRRIDSFPGGNDLYIDHYRLKNVLPVSCLQFVGTSYRRISTPRTEYNGFDGNQRPPLDRLQWSEAVFADMVDGSDDVAWLLDLARAHGWPVRRVATDIAYAIDTLGDFAEYLASLGKGTRLRLFNRRSVLEQCGEVVMDNWWPQKPDVFFELLNRFHLDRWGQPCFNATSTAFHLEFLRQLEQEGGTPELSVLSVAGRPVSVLYNVRYRNTVYNLQAGYIENLHKKIALGTLHLGYSIEAAFANPDARLFDMLAGGGKNEDYKARLATRQLPLVSLMLVRNPVFKALYWLKDFRDRKREHGTSGV